jgi:RNA polymerase sigma-70 factor (ECF subfamily)
LTASSLPAPSGDPGSTDPGRLTALRELQLVEAWRKGDAAALGELLEAYQRRVYSVCYRMLRNVDEASDLTQDSLIKVMEGLDKYDGRARLSTWVIRVTMNCCLSHLRKQKLRRHASLDEPADEGRGRTGREFAATAELSRVRGVEQDEIHEILAEALGALEPAARAILVLRDLQDLDYVQISEVLDVPVGTVKSRLFRARTALRAAVESLVSHGKSSPDPL